LTDQGIEERNLIDAKLEPLYQNGKFEDLGDAASLMEPKTDLGKGALLYWKGWREWRRDERALAVQLANQAVDLGDERGRQIRMYDFATRSQFDLLKAEMELVLPTELNVTNAILIAAQKPGCWLTTADVIEIIQKMKKDDESVTTANCYNNAGLALVLKSKQAGSVCTALECYERALRLYENIGIAHHIAALYYRISVAHQKLGDWRAYEAMQMSVKYWLKALEGDSDNESFQAKLASNIARRDELAKALGINQDTCAASASA
jgi:hypothetical protein